MEYHPRTLMILEPENRPRSWNVPKHLTTYYNGKIYTDLPLAVAECESFEEFQAHHMQPGVVGSSQNGREWFIAFLYNAFCGECAWPFFEPEGPEYLCKACRSHP